MPRALTKHGTDCASGQRADTFGAPRGTDPHPRRLIKLRSESPPWGEKTAGGTQSPTEGMRFAMAVVSREGKRRSLPSRPNSKATLKPPDATTAGIAFVTNRELTLSEREDGERWHRQRLLNFTSSSDYDDPRSSRHGKGSGAIPLHRGGGPPAIDLGGRGGAGFCSRGGGGAMGPDATREVGVPGATSTLHRTPGEAPGAGGGGIAAVGKGAVGGEGGGGYVFGAGPG